MKNKSLHLITIAFGIIIVGMGILFLQITNNRSKANLENAYGLVATCALSVPATERTKADIENCYLRVENKYDIDLERFYPNE